MYYVYRFLDKSQNVIYVGKTKKDLNSRFNLHSHLPEECYLMVYKIQYISCETEADMSIKEIYYINKYKTTEHYFFNILDITELPSSVSFDDKWKMYKGPLPAHFANSINFKKGYSLQKEIRYNKDGSLDMRKVNKQKGISSYVEGFNSKEVDLIVNHLINEINTSENNNQEQIRFRNLVMFILGVNLPLKPTEFLNITYGELFDENDNPKDYGLQQGRYQQNNTINIPLRDNVKAILSAYRQRYNLYYKNNANELMFMSREHQALTLSSWTRIIAFSAKAVNIKKNVGGESVRKTYGLNIYKKSKNKINALYFLGELWGQVREAKIIKYLGLSDENINFDYFFGDEFKFGNLDFIKINCLNKNICGEKLKNRSESRKNKKKYIQMDDEGNIINEFNSLSEAIRITNINSKSIRSCCKGVYKHAGGFVWKCIVVE